MSSLFRKKLAQIPQTPPRPKLSHKKRSISFIDSDFLKAGIFSDEQSESEVVTTDVENIEWKRSPEAEMIMNMLKKEAEKLDSGKTEERKTIELESINSPLSPCNRPISERPLPKLPPMVKKPLGISGPTRSFSMDSIADTKDEEEEKTDCLSSRKSTEYYHKVNNTIEIKHEEPEHEDSDSTESWFPLSSPRKRTRKDKKETPTLEINNSGVVWRRNPEAEKIMMMLQLEAEKDKKSVSPSERRNTIIVESSNNIFSQPESPTPTPTHNETTAPEKDKKIRKSSVSQRFFPGLTRSSTIKKEAFSLTRSDDESQAGLDSLGKEFNDFKALSPRRNTTINEIEQKSQNIDKRTQIILEIRASERTYVSSLETLKDSYCKKLVDAIKNNVITDISERKIKQIFGNISVIYNINNMLYSEIDSRINDWDHKTTLTLGDIFLDVIPYLKIYDQYGNNYNNSLDLLNECQKNVSFSSTLENIESSTETNLRIESMLIAPIQRLPRYILLLSDLKKNTPNDHPDFELLTKAIPAMQRVADHVDKNIQQAKSKLKLVELSSGGATSLLLAHRNLIYETELKCENKKKSIIFYLFNDILVHLTSSKAKHKPNLTLPEAQWPLHLIWFDNSSVKQIKLIGPTNEHYILKLANIDSPNNLFINKLQSAINTQLEHVHKRKHLNDDHFPTFENEERVGSYLFPNAVKYSGQWKSGLMHGKGVWTFLDHEYDGEFKENKKFGYGSMIYFTGNIYKGNWENDLPDGEGTLTYPTGDIYEGEFKCGKMNGKGTMKFSNGDIFDGYWKDNKPDGLGSINYHTGITYSGTFKNGRYHTYGVLSCSKTGMKYEGEWLNGFREGKGKMLYSDESTYDGYWKGGLRSGTGVFTSKTEGKYDGEWLADLKNGKGTMEFNSKNVYSGEWKDNTFHGTGKIIYASGSIALYNGEWEQNMKSGNGSLHYANGDNFEGTFKDDMKNGTGTYTYANGLVVTGKWTNDVLNGKTTISPLYKVDTPNFTGNLNDNIWQAGTSLPALHFHAMPDLNSDTW